MTWWKSHAGDSALARMMADLTRGVLGTVIPAIVVVSRTMLLLEVALYRGVLVVEEDHLYAFGLREHVTAVTCAAISVQGVAGLFM